MTENTAVEAPAGAGQLPSVILRHADGAMVAVPFDEFALRVVSWVGGLAGGIAGQLAGERAGQESPIIAVKPTLVKP